MAAVRGEDLITDGWFMEKNEQWPGQAFSLKVEEVIVSTRSKFQDILIFRNKQYGTVLVLDGVIQCTEFEEYAYQEMLAWLPMASHSRPKKVLIIGGGDGGVAREVAKHPDVESITMCEIDEEVINLSKQHLPYMSVGFNSPKLTIHIGDGFAFMENHKNEFDVIIADTSDPVGPAERLFSEEFYKLVHTALKEDGVASFQGESMWVHGELIKGIMDFTSSHFAQAAYATGYTPAYPCGQIGFLILSKNKNTDVRTPVRVFSEQEKEKMALRYYDEDVHKAAFVLPRKVKKDLGLIK